MKNYILNFLKFLLVLIFGLSFMAVTKGTCPTGTVTITTQAEIDNFSATYPGCTSLDALILEGNGIVNLEGIGHLTSIAGDFIVRNTGLKSFKRLDQLHTVGAFIVENNPELVRFSGTPKLATVTGDILIQNNPSLIHFDKLHTINSVGGDITLSELPAVIDFIGMHNIQSISGTLTIENCANLQSLEGFEGMTQLDEIKINNNASLTDISDIENIDESTLSSLTISNNGSLSDCMISSVCGFVGTDTSSPNGIITGNSGDCANAGAVQIVCMAAMPVELIDFSVRKNDDQVFIEWSTASEFNNSGFEIQHSVNATDWEVLSFVSGYGSTDRLNTYEFTDNAPKSGLNYYRLKQVDFDGSFEYLGINTVDFGVNTLTVFPNPASDQIQFTDDYRGAYEIYNSLGNVVLTGHMVDVIAIDQLKAGIYFIRLDQRENLIRFLIK
jgi:hypothetical protein